MADEATRKTRKGRPGKRIEEEAFVSLQRTADALLEGVTALLKGFGLSSTQYNVLRILRGAGQEGLPCRAIADRMITRDPDITRLLDRLEVRELVSRSRERRDRRVITTRITPAGMNILAELDDPMGRLHEKQLQHMSDQQLRSLIELLESARAEAR